MDFSQFFDSRRWRRRDEPIPYRRVGEGTKLYLNGDFDMVQSTYAGGTSARSDDKGYGRSNGDRDVSQMAAEKMRDGVKTAEDAASRMMEQGRQVGEGMQQVAGNFRGAVDQSLRDQPMATLAVAGIVGFVLGAIWKS
jgi:ElaB/YqjD/DUF883 family membrane-anchored ribosome-binding protein